MGHVVDLPAQKRTSAFSNAYSSPQEKLYMLDTVGETMQYSFFSARLGTITHAPSIQQLKSSSSAFEIILETGMYRGLWWLHVTSPSDKDIRILSRILGIHPLTTEDIQMREPREKIELFRPYYFVSIRIPQQPKMEPGVRVSSANVYCIVFRESIISFTYDNSEHPTHVWNRIKERQSHLALTSDWICYALIDDIVDGFAPLIDRIQAGVEMMEDSVSVTRPEDIGLALQTIYKYRKETTRICQHLHEKTKFIQSYARHCGGLGTTSNEATLYLSDIQDHVLTMMVNLSMAEQMLSRSQSKYLGQLSFDSTRMRNQVVGTLSRLTVIGMIVVMMQVITGLFGMNVHVPGLDIAGLSWWWGILGPILGLILLLLVIARRTQVV